MMTLKEQIDGFMNQVLSERDVRLDEKDKQVHLAAANKSSEQSTGDDHKKEQPSTQQSTSKISDDDGDAKKIENVPNSDDIAEKLNAIRSGRSLRDSGVKDRFERYVADLDDNEKIALFKFLKGIGQIITGDLEPERAIEPHDPPGKIHMHKKKMQTIKKKPSVTKVPSDGTQKPGVEDTSAPVPIKAK